MKKKAASAFPECLNYEELRAELGNLPSTWYPDLIKALVEAAYKKKVFNPGGVSTMIKALEDDKTKQFNV